MPYEFPTTLGAYCNMSLWPTTTSHSTYVIQVYIVTWI